MNFIQTIILKIAKKLGLQLQKKPLVVNDYNNIENISFTAMMAQKVATLTLMDSDIRVIGDSARALYLSELMQNSIIDKLDLACEVALGTGDCLIKPYTDGSRIGFDVIKNGDFYICDSVGDFIKSIIIKCETIKKQNGYVYERYETQKLIDTVDSKGNKIKAVLIYNFAFRDGIEVPLNYVESWENIEPEFMIPYVDKLLFGRIKSPTTNRCNINSVNGVPITFGLDSIMQKALEAYNRFNSEFELKEPFVLADKIMFRRDPETGKPAIPKGKDRVFMSLPSFGEKTGESIHEYSPDIRSTELEAGIEQNYKMLEMLAGLSSGILTSPTTNFATATEIKANLHNTYAYMTKFRRSITKGITQLLYAIDILCDMNEFTPMGEYKIAIDYSSAYLEDLTEQYTRLISAHGIGAVSTAEVRAWLMDEDLDTAQEMIDNIKDDGAENNLNNNAL